jgi:membrane-bound ClpP family serine protease
MEGKAVSRLAPIGKALIEDRLYEVRSDGSYIDSNSEIIVTRIEGNKIFVEIKN